MGRLEKIIAVITGGGGGIGKAIALQYCVEGATVIIAESNEQTGKETAGLIGGHFFKANISDENLCITLKVFGCIDQSYLEFNPDANINDGSCETLIVEGCMDANYLEYNPQANIDTDPTSCYTFKVYGCMDLTQCNYDEAVTVDDGSCYNNDVGCGCDAPAAAVFEQPA